MDDVNDSGSYAKSSQCYEQLRVMDDINDSASRDLKALNVMDSSGWWMI